MTVCQSLVLNKKKEKNKYEKPNGEVLKQNKVQGLKVVFQYFQTTVKDQWKLSTDVSETPALEKLTEEDHKCACRVRLPSLPESDQWKKKTSHQQQQNRVTWM